MSFSTYQRGYQITYGEKRRVGVPGVGLEVSDLGRNVLVRSGELESDFVSLKRLRRDVNRQHPWDVYPGGDLRPEEALGGHLRK